MQEPDEPDAGTGSETGHAPWVAAGAPAISTGPTWAPRRAVVEPGRHEPRSGRRTGDEIGRRAVTAPGSTAERTGRSLEVEVGEIVLALLLMLGTYLAAFVLV